MSTRSGAGERSARPRPARDDSARDHRSQAHRSQDHRSQDPRKQDDRGRRVRPAEGERGAGSEARPRRPRPAEDDRAGRTEAAPGFGPFARGDQERPPKREERVFRSVAEEAVARGGAPAARKALRIVKREPARTEVPPKPSKGRKARPEAVRGTVAPPARSVGRVSDAVVAAAKALDRGYEREAVRILKPHRDLHPENPDVRELLGVGLYRLGRWAQAQKEIEAFAEITGSAEQHPVLMDCARALGRHTKVAKLWDELRAASPAAAVMVEGRIVAAGSLADRGQLSEAIALLERAQPSPKRVAEHHLRLWYALADLHERAGDLPAARSLFRKVSTHDPSFVDVAERLAALS